jgi:hypothetical protein
MAWLHWNIGVMIGHSMGFEQRDGYFRRWFPPTQTPRQNQGHTSNDSLEVMFLSVWLVCAAAPSVAIKAFRCACQAASNNCLQHAVCAHRCSAARHAGCGGIPPGAHHHCLLREPVGRAIPLDRPGALSRDVFCMRLYGSFWRKYPIPLDGSGTLSRDVFCMRLYGNFMRKYPVPLDGSGTRPPRPIACICYGIPPHSQFCCLSMAAAHTLAIACVCPIRQHNQPIQSLTHIAAGAAAA